MNTSLQDFERWLGAPAEHERLEFKEAKNQFDTVRLFKYCVALANEGGGKLILGVTNSIPRKVVGSQAITNPLDIPKQNSSKAEFSRGYRRF